MIPSNLAHLSITTETIQTINGEHGSMVVAPVRGVPFREERVFVIHAGHSTENQQFYHQLQRQFLQTLSELYPDGDLVDKRPSFTVILDPPVEMVDTSSGGYLSYFGIRNNSNTSVRSVRIAAGLSDQDLRQVVAFICSLALQHSKCQDGNSSWPQSLQVHLLEKHTALSCNIPLHIFTNGQSIQESMLSRGPKLAAAGSGTIIALRSRSKALPLVLAAIAARTVYNTTNCAAAKEMREGLKLVIAGHAQSIVVVLSNDKNCLNVERMKTLQCTSYNPNAATALLGCWVLGPFVHEKDLIAQYNPWLCLTHELYSKWCAGLFIDTIMLSVNVRCLDAVEALYLISSILKVSYEDAQGRLCVKHPAVNSDELVKLVNTLITSKLVSSKRRVYPVPAAFEAKVQHLLPPSRCETAVTAIEGHVSDGMFIAQDVGSRVMSVVNDQLSSGAAIAQETVVSVGSQAVSVASDQLASGVASARETIGAVGFWARNAAAYRVGQVFSGR